MVDVALYKARLEARKNELEGRLEGIEHDLDQPAPADSEERAQEREGDEVLEDLGNAGLNELRAIEAALKRIEAGTFGECVNCGEDISAQRLEVVPHAPLCQNCAK